MFCFFKQKTADEMRISDWSSDVCSSDLLLQHRGRKLLDPAVVPGDIRALPDTGTLQVLRLGHDLSGMAGVNRRCGLRSFGGDTACRPRWPSTRLPPDGPGSGEIGRAHV